MKEPDDYSAYVKKWAPSEDAFVAVQRVAKPFIDRKDWEGAAAVFERYKPLFPGMEARFDAVIAILRAPSSSLKVMNLGSGVNTPYNEIKPSLTAEGTRLYFSSDRPGGRGKLDIYASQYENGTWQPAVNLGEKINTPDHETINSISFDGTSIFLYGGFAGHMGNGDNFYFEKSDKGWSHIMHLSPPVNSTSWDSDAFLTADGKALLFTSDRPGGIGKPVPKGTPFHGGEGGNSDIWVAVRRGNRWMGPINLGPKINTPYCERSAFLHPDGKTLYFSSDGHPGLGKLDVFKSVRLKDDSWTEWSEPVNLGKEINTSEDDWGYKISTDGRFALFSSTNLPGGFGQNDIYVIELPVEAQPASEVATIRGRLVDEDGNPLGATIRYGDLERGIEEGEARSDPQTGEFVLTLPLGKLYEIFFERDGFYPTSANLDLRRGGHRGGAGGSGGSGGSGGNASDLDPFATDSARLYNLDIAMTSVEGMRSKRDKYGDLLSQRLNNIFFDFAKWDLKPESYQELDRLVRFLESNPDIRIEICGHTDDVGSDEFNMELSKKRAESVVAYLRSKKIPATRLIAKGFGETRPEVPNDSEENRARNRRVEFKIAE
ncbi:MAG: OmpA family protein [Bacteroidota bacterium]|nr:OmpA family protein [Bacteroidota bacterium]